MTEDFSECSGVSGFLHRLNRRVLTAEKIFGGFLMGLMLAVILINIASRYVLAAPVFWGEELATFTFAWIALLSSAFAIGRNMHVRITMITDCFPKTVQKLVEIANCLIAIAAIAVFLPPSIEVLGMLVPSPAMRVPEEYVYCIVPITFSLFIFHLAVALARSVSELVKGR